MAATQRSFTNSVEVTLYSKKNDPILLYAMGFNMNRAGKGRWDTIPTIVGVSTSNVIGGSGTWSVTCKPQAGSNLFNHICDDDWVDIVFVKGSKKYHVMRGLVDDVRRQRSVSGGATSIEYVISGRDLTKVWEQTLMWFDMASSETLSDADVNQIVGSEWLSGHAPSVMVKIFLENAFKLQAKFGRANFAPPSTVPGASASSKFLDMISLNVSGFTNDPGRISVNANTAAYPSGQSLWQLALEWSDPLWCEMFTDTYKSGKDPAVITNGEGQPEEVTAGSKFVVVFRDRPFPTMELGKNSPWFSLPTYLVPRGQVGNDDVGRSGQERFNAFIASPTMRQESSGTSHDLILPFWNKDDINTHGIRKMDITTRYGVTTSGGLSAVNKLRTRLADWHSLNPYLLSGTIPLVVFRPDIRIGGRLRISATGTAEKDETYYIEGVANSWQHNTSRTTCTVTRGFEGDDKLLLAQLTDATGKYEMAKAAQ